MNCILNYGEQSLVGGENMGTLFDKLKDFFQTGGKIKATHILASGETLSGLSLRYYGHATEPYWRLIANANKELVGVDGRKGQPGMSLKIPALPASMTS